MQHTCGKYCRNVTYQIMFRFPRSVVIGLVAKQNRLFLGGCVDSFHWLDRTGRQTDGSRGGANGLNRIVFSKQPKHRRVEAKLNYTCSTSLNLVFDKSQH